jgi:hypothetical protein
MEFLGAFFEDQGPHKTRLSLAHSVAPREQRSAPKTKRILCQRPVELL